MAGFLDEKLVAQFTQENFKNEFVLYKKIKTDFMLDDPEVKIQMGVDGVSYETFSKNIDIEAKHVCKRIRDGNYFFKPFREVPIPKKPNMSLREAIRADEIRTLSIACIRDVIVQRLIYKALERCIWQLKNALNGK